MFFRIFLLISAKIMKKKCNASKSESQVIPNCKNLFQQTGLNVNLCKYITLIDEHRPTDRRNTKRCARIANFPTARILITSSALSRVSRFFSSQYLNISR
uniref:(northern house mosquito) hypothetical protein n=1 Tax=Culex pipiens TaxID=7175 RepID=A0A8D8KF08_CULPI